MFCKENIFWKIKYRRGLSPSYLFLNFILVFYSTAWYCWKPQGFWGHMLRSQQTPAVNSAGLPWKLGVAQRCLCDRAVQHGSAVLVWGLSALGPTGWNSCTPACGAHCSRFLSLFCSNLAAKMLKKCDNALWDKWLCEVFPFSKHTAHCYFHWSQVFF